MTLDDLCATFEGLRFPRRDEDVPADLAQVRCARTAVEAAVVDDVFLADCIAAELALLESGRVRYELTSFRTIPAAGIRFAFGYWAPGQVARPHEHAGWTITAVCRNELDVVTYDRPESYRRRALVAKNRFHAPAGKVGFIFDPCIHSPRNTSREWSLSLHVIGPRDELGACDQPEPLAALATATRPSRASRSHPYARVEAVRQQRGLAQVLRRIADGMRVPRRQGLLARCDALMIPAAAPRRLARVHPDLRLTCRAADDMVALEVETSDGPLESLTISAIALPALEFAAGAPEFEVAALPGGLSAEERAAVASALEESGLFTRAAV